jgi:hypothetical protein
VSVALLMYQFEPLSATIIPYFFSAATITCDCGHVQPSVKLAFIRRRRPIGGRFASVLLEAECVAGRMEARCVCVTVKRSA